MNKADILAMEAGPELDALVHVRVMGAKCYHLHRRPVNPNTIRHANAAKEICEDCGLRTYANDFWHSQKGYSRNIVSAKNVIGKLALSPQWNDFVHAFEEYLDELHPGRKTSAIILKTLDPLFVAQAAVISTLKGEV